MKSAQKMRVAATRLPHPLWQQIERMAENLHRSNSAIIRKSVELGLEQLRETFPEQTETEKSSPK